MEEFAKMIYETWARENTERDLFFDKGEELLDKLENILSFELNCKLYDTLCETCEEVEKYAFIEGFGYAVKCLSNGKIDLKGGAANE